MMARAEGRVVVPQDGTLLERMIEAIHFPPVGDYLRRVNALDRGNAPHYKSYIGVNLDRDGIADVKFYFTFYRELQPKEIGPLFSGGDPSAFFELHESRAGSLSNMLEGGSGYTFAVKVNRRLEQPRSGFYYKVKAAAADGFPSLPESVEAKRQGSALTMPGVKGIYREYGVTGDLTASRSLYYIDDPIYKSVLARMFDDPFLAGVPEIEFCVGDRADSDTPGNYRKAICLGDPRRVAEEYVHASKWQTSLAGLRQDAEALGWVALCPGVYPGGRAHSLYLFDLAGFPSTSRILTVENLVARQGIQ